MRYPSRSHVVVLVVAALVLVPAVAVALPDGQAAQAQAQSNASVAPGEQFAGVVGVQGAEVDGAVESRAYDNEIAAANSNASKARVVVDRMTALEDRVEELRDRRAELQTGLDNGSIERGQYRAQIATVAARIATVQQQLNRSESVTRGLPEQARRGAGLNVSAVHHLRASASNLSGGEVSEIARSIAGKGVGRGVPAGGPPEGVPGAGRGNGPGPNHGGPDRGDDMPGRSDQRGPPSDGNGTAQKRGT